MCLLRVCFLECQESGDTRGRGSPTAVIKLQLQHRQASVAAPLRLRLRLSVAARKSSKLSSALALSLSARSWCRTCRQLHERGSDPQRGARQHETTQALPACYVRRHDA